MPRPLPPGLYAIADAAQGDPVSRARALAAAGCRTIQLRAKVWSAERIHDAAQILAPALRAEGICFIINDHPDIARAVDADGVHLGQEDGSIEHARATVGPALLIGWSTHNLHQVQSAQGADYIGFGPVYTTGSKAGALTPTGPERLAAAVLVAHCPVVAIGGIGPAEVDRIRATGAHGWACIAALRGTPDLPGAVARMQAS